MLRLSPQGGGLQFVIQDANRHGKCTSCQQCQVAMLIEVPSRPSNNPNLSQIRVCSLRVLLSRTRLLQEIESFPGLHGGAI